MTEFESIINAANQGQSVPFDGQKNYGEQMQEKRAKCYAMLDAACHDAVSTPERCKQYLGVQSRFEKYSLNNNLLIFSQKPSAVKLKDFDAWKKNEVLVKKGAKSLMILEPNSYTAADGIERRGYHIKTVFDISDTTAPESVYPQPKPLDSRKILGALVHDAPVPIRRAEESLSDESAVYDVQSKTIYYKAGLDFEDIFPAMAKALAHADMSRDCEHYRVSDHEFQARCVAYVLASKVGVDVKTVEIHSIPQRYADMESEEIKKTLSDIHSSVKVISARMSEVLDRPKEKEQTQSQAKNRNPKEAR